MTSSKVKDSFEKIIPFIKNYINERKLVIAEETDSSIVGVYALGKLGIFFRWSILWDNFVKGYIVSLKIESTHILQIILSLMSLPIVLISILSPMKSYLIIIYIFVMLYGRALLEKAENTFFTNMEKEFVCSIERDPDITLFGNKMSWIRNNIMGVSP